VTSKNVEEMKAKSPSSEVRRLLGAEGKFGQMMGLSDDWMFNAIKQVGTTARATSAPSAWARPSS
jgi:hypothetical protein